MFTLIPGRKPIELVSYYDDFGWYYPNCEMQTKAWFVENVQKDWILLDVGANIGYYSILMAQLAHEGLVYAFEPTLTIEMLKANLVHNQIKNVIPVQMAVGSSSGDRTDRIFRVWGGEAEEAEYSFTTLDKFVSEHNLQKVDCLKIDVDSFDFECLLGAENFLRDHDPWLVVELNHALSRRGQSDAAAFAWLSRLGYKEALVLDNENYIMRRRSGAAWGEAGFSTLRMHFRIPPLPPTFDGSAPGTNPPDATSAHAVLSSFDFAAGRGTSFGQSALAYRSLAARVVGATGEDDVVVATTFGARMRIRPQTDLVTSRALLADGVYEREISEFVGHSLETGDVFIDVGANIGAHTLRAAAAVGQTGRVVSFEPNPTIRSRLVENVSINGYSNVVVQPVAVGTDPGSFKLIVSPGHPGSGFIRPASEATQTYVDDFSRSQVDNRDIWALPLPGATTVAGPSAALSAEVFDVEVRPLRDAIHDSMIGRISLVKIDVEGAEMDVLNSCKFLLNGTKPPNFIIEYEDRPWAGGRRDDIFGFFPDDQWQKFVVSWDEENRRLTFNRLRSPQVRSKFENLIVIHKKRVEFTLRDSLVVEYI